MKYPQYAIVGEHTSNEIKAEINTNKEFFDDVTIESVLIGLYITTQQDPKVRILLKADEEKVYFWLSSLQSLQSVDWESNTKVTTLQGCKFCSGSSVKPLAVRLLLEKSKSKTGEDLQERYQIPADDVQGIMHQVDTPGSVNIGVCQDCANSLYTISQYMHDSHSQQLVAWKI